MHNFPTDREIQNFYTLFCIVFSSLYNYALAKRLLKDRIYSWAITAYYYSLMHCARAICYMSLKCFPKQHSRIYAYMQGKTIRGAKWWKIDEPKGITENHDFKELIKNLPQSDCLNIEQEIKQLGDYLEKLKELREFNSYEMFIIAHQIGHGILTPTLGEAGEKIDQIVKYYLSFLLQLLFYYTQDKGEYFKAFLLDNTQHYRWAFLHLRETLESQRFQGDIISMVERLVNEYLLRTLHTSVDCPPQFYEKISYALFDQKKGIIRELSDLFRKIQVAHLIGMG